jgi:quinol monooxygenase YgiN
MLIVIGDATAAPGRRDELAAAARAVAVVTRADEGCVSYGFYADLEDDDRMVSVEIWVDRAALEEHMAHPHTEQFLAVAPGLVAGAPVMTFYDASAEDTP